jgi:hypothetical protein
MILNLKTNNKTKLVDMSKDTLWNKYMIRFKLYNNITFVSLDCIQKYNDVYIANLYDFIYKI